MERTGEYEVVVVGAGSAGLSAALVLGRARRAVLVLDGGEPRNAPSPGVQGFFTRDGILPGELLRIGREQLAPYPSVEQRSGRAIEAGGSDGSFEVTLEDGSVVRARKLLLASGVVDELPDRPGFRELWGRGVYHCPYCHGWEVRDRPIAVYANDEAALERVTLIRNWSRDLVLVCDGPFPSEDAAARERLEVLGVPVREGRISHLEGDPVAGRLESIVFEDGSRLEREALYIGPGQRQHSGLAEALGCEVVEFGPVRRVESDATTKETNVKGVYVAGDAGEPIQSVIVAASSGARAAYFINHTLCSEDVEAEISVAAQEGLA
jgi:thioredoxin reductase